MKNIDMIFLFVIAAFIGYYMCKKESFEGFADNDDVNRAVLQVYNADVDAIRNLSTIATELKNNDGITIPGGIKIKSGQTIEGQGKLHISGPESLYLLNKNGVIIGKEWGGNGNLNVQGNAQIDGQINTPEIKRIGGDWLRINSGGVGKTALYGNLAINDTIDGNSGLAVGSWNDKVGKGNIEAIGSISVGGAKSDGIDGILNIKNRDGKYTIFNQSDGQNYIRGNTIVDGNLEVTGNSTVNGNILVNGTSITLNGPNGNTFTFELSADPSRGKDDGQRMVIKNKRGNRVLDIYQGEVVNWKEGSDEPVTIFSMPNNRSILNVRRGGFAASTDQCYTQTKNHIGCNMMKALG